MGFAETDETKLIERARRGDRAAFEVLYARHQRQVRGFIRIRASNDTNTREIAHLTWLTVWQKLPTYDQSRSSFPTFVKYWASLVLLRSYEAQGLRRKVEVLFSEFISRFPDHDSSPPHQLIAFGFAKLLAWPPRKIVTELSEVRLKTLAERLESEYISTSQLPEERVRPYFKQLRKDLGRRFREAAKDPRTRSLHSHLLHRIVGETTLQEYYTGGTDEQYAADITKWWDAVRRRVWKAAHRLPQGPLFSLVQEKSSPQLARKSSRAGISS